MSSFSVTIATRHLWPLFKPCLSVAGSQWTDQLVAPPIRAFAKGALQGLDMRNMPESHLFKTGEAFEPVRVDGRAGSHI
jgi:hypothetical protein